VSIEDALDAAGVVQIVEREATVYASRAVTDQCVGGPAVPVEAVPSVETPEATAFDGEAGVGRRVRPWLGRADDEPELRVGIRGGGWKATARACWTCHAVDRLTVDTWRGHDNLRPVIVVATADFEVYHGVVGELRDRGLTFTTVEPGDDLPDGTAVVVTAADESHGPDDVDVVRADPDQPRRAVDEVTALLRGGDGKLIVGIDPGDRPGIAVLSGEMIVAAFQVPSDQVAAAVEEEIGDAVDPLVRIGDGARLLGASIIDDLGDVTVELVDETGTTPYLGTGARGMGDVLAAVNIARIEGEEIESREIDPTAGELKRIKQRSREASETNRAIGEALARRVADGELTIEEALAEHRDRGTDE